MMLKIWFALKLILSSFLSLVGIWIVIITLTKDDTNYSIAFGIMSVCFFLAALPWVSSLYERPIKASRSAGLVSVVLGLIFFIMASSANNSDTNIQQVCDMAKYKMGCEFTNWLYDVGGGIAVGIQWYLLSAMFFVSAIVMFKYAKRYA